MIRYLFLKYLRPEGSIGFISLTKWLAFIGIALGVCVLLVSMAVMNGMNKSFMDRLLSMNYPITAYPRSLAIEPSELPAQFLPSPFLQAQIAIKRGNELTGAVLFGVDFAKELKINRILETALKSLAKEQNISAEELARKLDDGYYLILGERLANKLSANQSSKLHVIFSELSPNAFSMAPLAKRFEFATSFKSGLAAYDMSYAFTSLNNLQKILKTRRISGIHLASSDPENEIVALKDALDDHFAFVGWWEQNGNILSAIKLEKTALFVILMMLVVIAALNIITSLLMIVLNRRKEIALLLALGASSKEVRWAFFATGFSIGLAGIVAGCILACLLMYALGNFPIINLPEDVYGSSNLPMDLSTLDASLIVFGALIVSALAALYPAHKASGVDVLDTLRQD